jgi:UDPglucose 6-dehydrogenase
VKALIAIAQAHNYDFSLLKAVYQINQETKERFVEKVVKILSGVKGKILAVWGLSFKPNTDDMREAPSIGIIKKLQAKGAMIKAFDPAGMDNAARVLTDITFCQSPKEAAIGSEAVLVLTEWNEFKQLDLAEIKKVMKSPYLFDGRNIYDPEKAKQLGFFYHGIGRS